MGVSVNLAWVGPTVVSSFALVIALITLWRTHLSPFRIVSVVGPMNFRLHVLNTGSSDRKFASNFAVAIGVTNAGARLGRVLAIRAKICYPELPPKPAFETLLCVGEYDPVKYLKHSRETTSMFQEAKLGDLTPFVVLPRDTVTKFVVFRGFWDDRPVSQRRIYIELECLTDRVDTWHSLGKWEFPLGKHEWGELVLGSTFTSHSDEVPGSAERRPSNLSEYLYDLPQGPDGAH
jgi:hypothetical protein